MKTMNIIQFFELILIMAVILPHGRAALRTVLGSRFDKQTLFAAGANNILPQWLDIRRRSVARPARFRSVDESKYTQEL